jgi:hypothetical protein
MKILTSKEACSAFLNGMEIRRKNTNVRLKNNNNCDVMDAVMYIISFDDWVLVGK